MSEFDKLTDFEKTIVLAIVEKNTNGMTWEEIAEKIGTTPRTLFSYRKKPHIKNAVREVSFQGLEDDIPLIFESLRKNIKRGHFQSIELAVKMLGMLTERQEIRHIEDNKIDEKALQAELAELEKQFKVIKGGK